MKRSKFSKLILLLSAGMFSLAAISQKKETDPEVHVIEAEDLIGDNSRILYGNDNAGAFKAPYLYRNESGCWSIATKKGVRDVLKTEINCSRKTPYYLYVRVGVRDRDSSFTVKIGNKYVFDIKEKRKAGQKYIWLGFEKALEISGKTPVELIFNGDEAVVDCIVISSAKNIPPEDCSPFFLPYNKEKQGALAAIYPAFNFKIPLYICAGTAQQFMLAHSNPGKKPVRNWTLKMTLPGWMTLMDPSIKLRRKEGKAGTLAECSHFSRPFAAPHEMIGPKELPDGRKEYTLKYTGCELPPKVNSLRNHYLSKYLYMIVFKALKNASGSGKLRLECIDSKGNANVIEQEIVCLESPERPSGTSSICALHASYMEYLSREEQKALVESMAKFGANTLILGQPKTQEDIERDEIMADICSQNGIDLSFVFHRFLPYCHYDHTISDSYTKKYPQYKGVKGKLCKRAKCSVVELEHLANDRSEYLLKQIKNFSDLMNKFNLKKVMIDFEESTPLEFSFSKASIGAFRKFAKISPSENLNEDAILKKYKNEWIDFRCRQNFRVIGNLVRLLREYVKGAKIMLYSGYQKDQTKKRYGIDWKYAIPEVDYALGGCGIATPQHTIWIYDTYLALKKAHFPPEKFMFCEHSIDDWAGCERFSPPDTYGARGILAVASGASGGIYSWYWGTMDGLTLKGFNQVAGLLSKLEKEGMLNAKRKVFDLNGSGFLNGAIMLKKGRTILFVCNVFSNPRNFSIKKIKENLNKYKGREFFPGNGKGAIELPDEVFLKSGKFIAWDLE